jgi:hypothetical protein
VIEELGEILGDGHVDEDDTVEVKDRVLAIEGKHGLEVRGATERVAVLKNLLRGGALDRGGNDGHNVGDEIFVAGKVDESGELTDGLDADPVELGNELVEALFVNSLCTRVSKTVHSVNIISILKNGLEILNDLNTGKLAVLRGLEEGGTKTCDRGRPG